MSVVATADVSGLLSFQLSCPQDDLRKEDFSSMGAQLLYKMIKSKTEYPLHKAIRVEREDVVFLYLIETDSQVLTCFCPNKPACFSLKCPSLLQVVAGMVSHVPVSVPSELFL